MLDSIIQVLNEAGETWWRYVFPLTWTSSLVAAFLLAVVWIGRRWPAQLRYAIVLIALIKFAVPPTLTSPVGLFNWFGPTIVERTEPPTLSDQPMDSEADNSTWTSILSAWEQLSWRAQLMLLHITGMVLAGAWTVSRAAQLAGMAHTARCVTTGKWFDFFRSLSKQFGLNRPVSLLVSTETVPPMAFGLLRPCVMVPTCVLRDLPLGQIKTMLAHELAHHKRADLWINALQNVLGILWWFNPLALLLNQVVRRIREDCCDDLLLCRNITTDSKYCDTLLQIAANLRRSARMIAALGFAETAHPLGLRIKRIMDPKVYRWARLSFGTVVSVLILAALLVPGLRSERRTAPADTPLVLEVPAPTEPQTVAGLSEELHTNTQDRTEDFAGTFPQQTGGIQSRVYASLKATNKITISSALVGPKLLKTVDSVGSPNHGNVARDTITDIVMTAAAGNSDLVKGQKYRLDDPSKSTPLLSSGLSGYSGGFAGGGGFGSAVMDTLALDIITSRYADEGSLAYLSAVSFTRNVSGQYMTSIGKLWPGEESDSLKLDVFNLIDWTEVLGPLGPTLTLSSLAVGSSSTAAGPDTSIANSLDDLLGDEVLIVSAASMTNPGYTAESTEPLDDEAEEPVTLASSSLAGDSLGGAFESTYGYNSLDFAPNTLVCDPSDSAEAIDTVDVTESVMLACADAPSSIDFAASLDSRNPNSGFIPYSLSNPGGTSVFGASSSSLAYSSYTLDTIPEPMIIWVLLVAGGLFLLRRRPQPV